MEKICFFLAHVHLKIQNKLTKFVTCSILLFWCKKKKKKIYFKLNLFFSTAKEHLSWLKHY